MPCRESVLKDSCSSSRSFKENRLPITIKRMEAMVIKPKPPICISERMTSLPNSVNASPVFTTVRPVTQTAEVAVNNASIKVTPVPS